MFTSQPLQRDRVGSTRGAGRATGRDDDGEREEGQQNWDKCTTGADEHLGRNGWVVVSGTALGLGVTDKARRGFFQARSAKSGKNLPVDFGGRADAGNGRIRTVGLYQENSGMANLLKS